LSRNTDTHAHTHLMNCSTWTTKADGEKCARR